jgi:serine/threonine protein kinase
MTLGTEHILFEGATLHPHEAEAIAFLKRELPALDSIRFWGLVEIIDSSGRRYELDAVITGPHALYVVEIKSWPGRLTGTPSDWTITFPDGHRKLEENPLRVTNLKAKMIASYLDRRLGEDRPRVEPLIFLSHPDIKNELTEAARNNVTSRSTVVNAIVQGKVPGAGTRISDRPVISKNTVAALCRELKTYLHPTAGSLKVNDLLVGGVIGEGPGYQDRVAEHEVITGQRARLRFYLLPQQATAERRDQLRRAAEREARTLTVLGDNRNVLRVQHYVSEAANGCPCVVFEGFDGGAPLDAWLRAEPDLSFADRISILQQLCEALAFCHRKGVLHRGLHPGAVLVRRKARGEPLEVKLKDFQLSSKADGSLGTVHLSALSADPASVFRAPEVIEDPNRASEASDLFSLGVVAYLVLTGRMPGTTIVERQALLDAGGGHLSLGAATDGLSATGVLAVAVNDLGVGQRNSLEVAVAEATDRHPDNRPSDVTDWMNDLLSAASEPDPREQVDPLEARADDELEHGLRVLDLLGSGSTARVFRVARSGSTFALKVPLSPEFQDRLAAEADALDQLESDRIVQLHERLTLKHRACLLLTDAGESRAHHKAREGPPPLDDAGRWGDDLLLALQALEEKGLHHRDIKPGNLGVLGAGSKKARHLLLFDFSLAGAYGSTEVGTPAYRDPFVHDRGSWDEAADRWSAAITLYEMLTGTRPTFGEAAAVTVADEITLEGERFDASVRDRLLAFFTKALKRDASQRHVSAEKMRTEWNACFAASLPAKAPQPAPQGKEASEAGAAFARTADATGGDDEAARPTLDPAALVAVLPTTAIESLPLSVRARSALDRAGVATVQELLGLPRNQLSAMRGVGREVAREIHTLRELLQSVRGGALAQPVALPKPFWPGAAPMESLDTVEGLPPEALARLVDAGFSRIHQVAGADEAVIERALSAFTGAAALIRKHLDAEAERARRSKHPTTIEAWVEALLPTSKGKKASKTWAHDIRVLFGLDMHDGRRIIEVRELAKALQKTPQALYIALSKARAWWSEHQDVELLRERVLVALLAAGDVAPMERVAERLESVLPHEPGTPAGEAAGVAAEALVRVICEVSRNEEGGTDGDGPAFGRFGGVAGPRWIGGSDAHVLAARRLGDAADRLAARDPLASSEQVRISMEAAVQGSPLAGRPAEALIALAAEASTRAAVSARLELYPRGLAPERAIRLCSGVLAGGEHHIADVQRIVKARYPQAAPIPGRPDLDALLTAALNLKWDDATATYRRPDAGPVSTSHTQIVPTRKSTIHSDGPPRQLSPAEVEKREFDDRLKLAAERGYFRVFDVSAPYADVAAEWIAKKAGSELVPLDRALLEAAEALAQEQEGKSGLASLTDIMQQAGERVLATWKAAPCRRVLTRPGLVARYGLEKFLSGVLELGQTDDAPALFLVNPTDDSGLLAVRGTAGAQLPIPLTSPAQRVRVPDSWIRNDAPQSGANP